MLFEEGITEDLLEVRRALRFVVFAEGVELDAERLCRLEQQRGGERSLIVLDEVHVARRNAEPLGELQLREPSRAAQIPHLCSEMRASFHHLPRFTHLPLSIYYD